MTLEQAIEQYENSERMNKELAEKSMYPTAKAYYLESAEKCRQMIAWLRILMDREQAIEKLNDIRCHVKETSAEEQALVMAIEALKQPEIVRCGECRHRDPEDKKCDCGHAIIWQLPRDDDWYCADAERRTE